MPTTSLSTCHIKLHLDGNLVNIVNSLRCPPPRQAYFTHRQLTIGVSFVFALPCLALPCLALPCLALPCLALPCLALPCLFLALPKETNGQGWVSME